jgi:hypothetical protein
MAMTTAQREPGNSAGGDSSSQPHGERRSHVRVAVDLFVQERDGDRLFVHPATNQSASGIFIESHSYSLRNALDRHFIDLEFQLPEQAEPINVRGEVIGARRTRGFSHGLAVRFLDLKDSDREALATYVAHKLAEGAGEGPASEAAPV